MSGFFKVTVLSHYIYFNYLVSCVCLFICSTDFMIYCLPEYRLSTGGCSDVQHMSIASVTSVRLLGMYIWFNSPKIFRSLTFYSLCILNGNSKILILFVRMWIMKHYRFTLEKHQCLQLDCLLIFHWSTL